jgi:hypothetical protein
MFKLCTRLAMLIVLAAIGLATVTGTASASRSISVTPGGGITARSLGPLTFRTTLLGQLVNVQCTVNLTGSINNLIPKVHGSSFGQISNATASPCLNTVGQATTADPQGEPWALTYLSFTGTLPNITLIQFLVNNATFRLAISPIDCTFSGTVPASILLTAARPNTTAGLIHVLRNRVPVIRDNSGAGCPTDGELVGLFNLAQRQTLILL